MDYLLGIDLGTSAAKTMLFDINGVPVASHTVEYPLYQPYNGWAEQNPNHWWQAVKETIAGVLGKSGVAAEKIKSIGLSGQMHGLVMLDEAGRVLRHAILWCDGRSKLECEEMTARIGREKLMSITANPALPGFTASKILWVRKHEPEIYEQCRHILLPKDYIRYQLTGEFATEVSDASGTNLMDVPKRKWSAEIFTALDIAPTLLGRIYESTEISGTLTSAAARASGLKKGTPVVGGGSDNAAAAVGTGVVEAGKAFTTLGTSGVILAHSDHVAIDPQGRIHTFCAAVPNTWMVMSCTLAAGLSLQWLRNNFFSAEQETARLMDMDSYELMNRQAERSPIGANRLLFLPYLMGERSPLLDTNARGAFVGLSAIHTKRDLLRSVMEGVAYSQRHCLDVLREMQVDPAEMLVCGGGAKSALWRQMLADLYGCPVKTLTSDEGPALGAAILAGVGAGVWNTVAEGCKAVIEVRSAQNPIPTNSAAYEDFYQIYRGLYPVLRESFQALAGL